MSYYSTNWIILQNRCV